MKGRVVENYMSVFCSGLLTPIPARRRPVTELYRSQRLDIVLDGCMGWLDWVLINLDGKSLTPHRRLQLETACPIKQRIKER